MGIEATVLTALVTLVVLAGVSLFMVLQYKRTHTEQVREALIVRARKLGIASPEDLTNHDLGQQIREAKREQKQNRIKTA